jgi:hypothetical protein
VRLPGCLQEATALQAPRRDMGATTSEQATHLEMVKERVLTPVSPVWPVCVFTAADLSTLSPRLSPKSRPIFMARLSCVWRAGQARSHALPRLCCGAVARSAEGLAWLNLADA